MQTQFQPDFAAKKLRNLLREHARRTHIGDSDERSMFAQPMGCRHTAPASPTTSTFFPRTSIRKASLSARHRQGESGSRGFRISQLKQTFSSGAPVAAPPATLCGQASGLLESDCERILACPSVIYAHFMRINSVRQ